MLKQRILTAVILIPLVFFIIFYSASLFYYFTFVMTLMAAYEWCSLMQLFSLFKRAIYILLMALMLYFARFFNPYFIILTACGFWCMALISVISYPKNNAWWQKHIFIQGIMGFLVLVPTFLALNLIRAQSIQLLLSLLLLIWGADTSAYFFGKKWGKNKLLPLVSPGKSWQGFIGALFFTALLVLFWAKITEQIQAIFTLILFAESVVIFSIVGDLFESMLKRHANLKDSSQLLPGHGGLLDRIDSLTAAAPIFVLGAVFFNFLKI